MLGRNCGKLIIEASEEASDGDSDAKPGSSDTSEILDTGSGADADEYLGRFSFRYPYAHLETLPEKISVSRLSPTVLDGNEKDGADREQKDLARRETHKGGQIQKNYDQGKRKDRKEGFLQLMGKESAQRKHLLSQKIRVKPTRS